MRGGAGLFWQLAPPEQISGMYMKERRAQEAGNKYAFVLQCQLESLVLIPTAVQGVFDWFS